MARCTSAEKAELDTRRVEQVYSLMAGVYDGVFDWALGPGRKQAVSALDVQSGDRVLEVGVGTGLSLPLYRTDCLLTGIDISVPMLDLARSRAELPGTPETRLMQMDAAEMSFPDSSFDRVLAPYVISVVSDPGKAMSEIRRVCRPGGTIVIVNHFLSENRVLAFLERALTPISRWIGFRLDLPVEEVTGTDPSEIVLQEQVNLLGLWRLLKIKPDCRDQ